MPKADCAYNMGADSSVPMAGTPCPATPSTTTHRRGLLAGAAAALVAGVAAAVPMPAGAAGADPVLPLYRRWIQADGASKWLDGLHRAARGRAPEADQRRLLAECDRWSNTATDIAEQIMATPATSKAGAIAKLRMAAEIWPRTKPADEFEFHEDMARSAILDAVRLLGGAQT